MKKLFLFSMIITATLLQLTACSKSSTNEGTAGSSLNIPTVTGPVTTTSSQSFGLSPMSSVIKNSSHLLIGGTTPTGSARFPYISGMTHFSISKLPDITSCLVKALVSNGLVSKDGTEYIFIDSDSNSKTKMAVTAEGDNLSNFKIYQCSSDSQTQFMSASLSGENVTFSYKGISGSDKTTLELTGTYTNSNWTSKQVSIYSYQSSTYSFYRSIQYADSLVSLYTGPSVKIYSKYALSGATTKDYTMGAGSVKIDAGSGSNTNHWDANLSDTSTASSYASDVTAGSYLTAISSFTSHDISIDESWNCQNGTSTVLNGSNISSAQQQSVSQSLQSCMSDL
ncbi:MAG: hypothetical protein L6Q37_00800 [Bdellovibrionaceae bacterium]|nr:hypothetical protein [Pseudobdellovibrionaceae bacterium]NUM58935.1 hypothetical protein [Pseudobdellovibrionaceae bacterium]